MPTPLAEGLENSFAPQMIFLWPPARGVGKLLFQTIFQGPFILFDQQTPFTAFLTFELNIDGPNFYNWTPLLMKIQLIP